MKCKACNEQIPSKFTHSIKINTCPLCGEQIMDEILQEILNNLSSLMKKAEENNFIPDVEEWLSSNYKLNKSNKTINTNNNLDDDNDFSEEGIKKQTEAAKTAEQFQKAAGVKKSNLKDIIEKIQNGGGAAAPEEFVGEDEFYGHIDLGEELKNEGANIKPISEKDAMDMVKAMNLQSNKNTDDDSVLKEYYELQKLKRLQRAPTGGGKFYRGEDQ